MNSETAANIDIFKAILFLKNGYKILFILGLSLRKISFFILYHFFPGPKICGGGQIGRILRKEKM